MKPISEHLFTFSGTDKPTPTYERCSAKDLGLGEAWLRDAIFADPELVIGPCRAAGVTDDEWHAWQCEYTIAGIGRIDVLLVSSQGRVAIVETKLASNPELRRRVLAQALDYLAHLAEQFSDSLPMLPLDEGVPVANEDDIVESVADGDVLVIIAGDDIDSRVTKLSGRLLSDHLVKQWDLALVDVALYRSVDKGDSAYLVVPHLRNLIESDLRQVVRVVVEGETPSARITVERVERTDTSSSRQKWDEQKFFERLQAGTAPASVQKLATALRDVAQGFPNSVSLSWGTGKRGSMAVKRNNAGLIELYMATGARDSGSRSSRRRWDRFWPTSTFGALERSCPASPMRLGCDQKTLHRLLRALWIRYGASCTVLRRQTGGLIRSTLEPSRANTACSRRRLVRGEILSRRG